MLLQRYPQLLPVIIEADTEVIRRRLENRGREEATAIDHRIKRQPVMPVDLPDVIRIQNNGTLEEGGRTLLDCFHSLVMVR